LPLLATDAASAAPQLGIETARATAAVVHGENVDEALTNGVVDAVGKAVKASPTHTAVRNDVRLGMPRDAREAASTARRKASPRPSARDSYHA